MSFRRKKKLSSSGSSDDGSGSGSYSQDVSRVTPMWEAATLLGKLLSTTAMLKGGSVPALLVLSNSLEIQQDQSLGVHPQSPQKWDKGKVFEVMLSTEHSHHRNCNLYMKSLPSTDFQATISVPHNHI